MVGITNYPCWFITLLTDRFWLWIPDQGSRTTAQAEIALSATMRFSQPRYALGRARQPERKTAITTTHHIALFCAPAPDSPLLLYSRSSSSLKSLVEAPLEGVEPHVYLPLLQGVGAVHLQHTVETSYRRIRRHPSNFLDI